MLRIIQVAFCWCCFLSLDFLYERWRKQKSEAFAKLLHENLQRPPIPVVSRVCSFFFEGCTPKNSKKHEQVWRTTYVKSWGKKRICTSFTCKRILAWWVGLLQPVVNHVWAICFNARLLTDVWFSSRKDTLFGGLEQLWSNEIGDSSLIVEDILDIGSGQQKCQDVKTCKSPRNLQQDPRFTDPEKTWVSI